MFDILRIRHCAMTAQVRDGARPISPRHEDALPRLESWTNGAAEGKTYGQNIGGGDMAGVSNTSRTLEYLRTRGWVVDKVEQFNAYAGKFGQRKDMFGFGDIIAMGENSIIAIQSCGQAFSEHHKKITEDERVAPNAFLWVKNGGRLMLIGWRKVKLKRGGKAMRWQPRIKEYTIDDFIQPKEEIKGEE